MSGRTAKIIRKYCKYTKRSKRTFRAMKKNYTALSWVDKQDSRDEIFDMGREAQRKMGAYA